MILAVTTVSSSTLAQGFPYQSFEHSSLGVVTAELSNLADDPPDKPHSTGSEVIIAKIQRIVVRVTYRGPHRPADQATAKFIQDYEKAIQPAQALASRYEEEYLFEEGGKEYWLQVQKPVAAYFERELRPGEPVDLYALAAGGVLENGTWRWVIPVEEFQSIPISQ